VTVVSSDANGPITLLICDDHRILTDALAMVVERDGTLRMIASPVHVPEEAIELCRVHQPDVVLMDIVFKGHMDGIKATRKIKEVSPATKVVIMTAHDDDRLLVEAVEAGASGFLGKEEAANEVLSAAKAAAEGEVLIDPATLTRLLHQVSKERQARRDAEALLGELTDREREILQLLAEGMRNEGIARKLFISPQTVQTHVRNLLAKLEVHSKLEAVAFAVKHGWITI
jgi:NarL family two-component system response regulator LiaR